MNEAKKTKKDTMDTSNPPIFLTKDYDTRLSINKGDALLLTYSINFNQRIKSIRDKFNIPNLTAKDDFYGNFITDEYGREAEINDSYWLDEQGSKVQNQFEHEIKKILINYKLPSNFYDWIRGYILYGKPNFLPLFNFEVTWYAENDIEELRRVGLTTKEKKSLKNYMRLKLGIKKGGRPTKETQKKYNDFIKNIDSCKSKRRGYKNLDLTLKLLSMNKKETFEKQYWEIMDNIYDELNKNKDVAKSFKQEKRINQQLRKRKSRAVKRFNK